MSASHETLPPPEKANRSAGPALEAAERGVRLYSMGLLNAGTIGFKEIWAHKFRSLLTMLGIILGVSSLVAMSALVKGMENGMREALIAIGGLEKVRVEEADIPADQAHLLEEAVGTTMNDVYALQ